MRRTIITEEERSRILNMHKEFKILNEQGSNEPKELKDVTRLKNLYNDFKKNPDISNIIKYDSLNNKIEFDYKGTGNKVTLDKDGKLYFIDNKGDLKNDPYIVKFWQQVFGEKVGYDYYTINKVPHLISVLRMDGVMGNPDSRTRIKDFIDLNLEDPKNPNSTSYNKDALTVLTTFFKTPIMNKDVYTNPEK